VRVLVVIEDVRDAELADRKDPAIGAARSTELVRACLDRFAIAVQIERLAHK
jgi:hypothetical protein